MPPLCQRAPRAGSYWPEAEPRSIPRAGLRSPRAGADPGPTSDRMRIHIYAYNPSNLLLQSSSRGVSRRGAGSLQCVPLTDLLYGYVLTVTGDGHSRSVRAVICDRPLGGIVVKLTKLGYFAEFFLYPPLILICSALAFHGAAAPSPVTWALVFAIGLLGWTLVEYLLHRIVFHHAPLIAELHERHHHDPRELIGTPPWVSISAGLIGFAIPFWAALGFNLATAATAGMSAGYLWFIFVHYTIHRWELRQNSYLYRVRLRHARHHYVSDTGNFGVTTGVWDHVFGTALDRRNSASRPDLETGESAR